MFNQGFYREKFDKQMKQFIIKYLEPNAFRKAKEAEIIGMWMRENPHLKPIITSFTWHVAIHYIKHCHNWDCILKEIALLFDPFQITGNSKKILTLRSVRHAVIKKIKELGIPGPSQFGTFGRYMKTMEINWRKYVKL